VISVLYTLVAIPIILGDSNHCVALAFASCGEIE
jgi:hypothetical protein